MSYFPSILMFSILVLKFLYSNYQYDFYDPNSSSLLTFYLFSSYLVAIESPVNNKFVKEQPPFCQYLIYLWFTNQISACTDSFWKFFESENCVTDILMNLELNLKNNKVLMERGTTNKCVKTYFFPSLSCINWNFLSIRLLFKSPLCICFSVHVCLWETWCLLKSFCMDWSFLPLQWSHLLTIKSPQRWLNWT